MSLSINTNISALNTIDSLDQTDQNLQTSIERLSTGLRVNSPADDPAAFVMSQGLKSQIAGLTQASQNTQSAINLAKTASGAMNQIAAMLQQMRGLAVSSANAAVVDSTDLQANQTQISSILSSIDQIASSTQFGSLSLLDGTAGVQANITDATDVGSLYLGSTFNGSQVQSGPVTIQKVTAATEAQLNGSQLYANPTSTVATGGVLVLNGDSIAVSAGETIQGVVAAVNQAAGTTGVTASLVSAGAGQYAVQLTQTNYGSQYGIDLVDPGQVIATASPATASGTDAVFQVSATTAQGVQTVAFTGGQTSGATGLQLSDGAGDSLTLTAAGNAGFAAAASVAAVTAGSVQFQVGANATQVVSYSLPSMFASALGGGAVAGQTLATVDVGSPAGANTAIQVIDAAISQVATAEGRLGSFQADVLQTAATSAGVASQNFAAASSTIADTDMAAETTTYTQNQVLEQSGLAMLAQANQNPAQLLSLLKNL